MTENVPTKQIQPPKPAPDPEGRMTFTAHLGELRTRLIHSLVAVLVGFFVCYAFSKQIIGSLQQPLNEFGTFTSHATDAASNPEAAAAAGKPFKWMVTTPFEGFMVQLKISAYAGIVLALPVIIYEICAFVFPGLTATEKRVVRIMLFGGATLAVVGVGTAYFAVLRTAMPGILSYVPKDVEVNLKLSETLTLILQVLLAFGLAFQMPMIVLVLVYLGILTPAVLKASRKFAIMAVVIFAAVLTPPDVVSMVAMALPLYLLYEFSILVSHVVVRRKAKAAAAAGA